MHAKVRQAGPVGFLSRCGVDVMGRHRSVQPALKGWQTFSSEGGSGLPDIRKPDAWRAPSPIVEVDPPRHTQVRTAVQRILSPHRARSTACRTWRRPMSARLFRMRPGCGTRRSRAPTGSCWASGPSTAKGRAMRARRRSSAAPTSSQMGTTRTCSERALIAEQFAILKADPAKARMALEESMRLVVAHDGAVLRRLALLDDLVEGISLHTSHKDDAPVVHHDGAGAEVSQLGNLHVGHLAVGDHAEARQVTVVVENQVQLHGALATLLLGPGVHGQAQVNDGGVDAHQWGQMHYVYHWLPGTPVPFARTVIRGNPAQS